MTLRNLALCIGIALLAAPAFAQGPAVAPPQPVAPSPATTSHVHPWETEPLALPGSLSVVMHRATLTDIARDKQLQLVIRFPTRSVDAASPSASSQTDTGVTQPAPALALIIFSHGMGGDREAFAKLSEHWASHNFIVVHVTHSDSIKLRREQGEKVTLSSARDVRSVDPADRLADVVYLASNPKEVEALISAALPASPNAIAPTIDMQHIFIAGHSAGALTTMLAINVKARMRIDGARARDMLARTERGSDIFKAGIVISGQGTTNRMLGEDSWNALRVPMLVLAGSKDVANVGNETPESRRHPFEKSRGQAAGGPSALLLWIEGATHGSYQGKDLTTLLKEDIEVDVNMVTAATRASTLAFLLAAKDNTLHTAQAAPVEQRDETLSARAARVLQNPSWMPALTDNQATLTSK
jgi:predicted dienelactone hydrolase